MKLDRHPIALIAAGELSKREAQGSGCAYLFMPELRERTGLSDAELLRAIADAAEAGRFRVSAVEVER